MPRMLAIVLALALQAAPQDPADGITVARRAVVAAEQRYGADSLEVGEELVRLFGRLSGSGADGELLAIAERVVAIREAKLPPDSPRLGVALSNLATVHILQRRPELAMPVLLRAHAILAKSKPSRAMLGVLANLGACCISVAEYASALRWLDQAVAYGREHTPDHPMLAQALQVKACALLAYGEVDAARQLVQETVDVLAKTEPDGRRHAHGLLSLGCVLQQAGRLDDAEPLLQRALEMRRQFYGDDHAEVGVVLGVLASVAEERGDIATARRHIEAALATKPSGPRRFERTWWQLRLASLLAHAGQLPAAVEMAAAAVRTAREHGAEDRQIQAPLISYGRILAQAGRPADAVDVLERALASSEALGVDTGLVVNSARSALALCHWQLGDVGAALARVTANLSTFDRFLDRMLPAMSEADRLRLVGDNRHDLDRLLLWTRQHAEAMPPAAVYGHVLAWKGQVGRGVLARQMAARTDAEGMARMRRLAATTGALTMGQADDAMLVERERLLTAISRSCPDRRPLDVAAIEAALPVDGALVDFVLTGGAKERRYEAFVVKRDGVQRVDLGPAAPIDEAVHSHLALLARSTRAGAAKVAEPVARLARQRLFEPLLPAIGDATTLLVSPDDVLATVPFETLPDSEPGSFLVERFAISYLQDASDLVRPPPAPAATHVLAFGDIRYGDESAVVADGRGAPRPFVPLPGTASELSMLAAAAGDVGCTVVRGADATEARLRELVAGASHVHLATHGFCGVEDTDGALRAGVALAGANEPAAADDGILTVEEASLLDLRACRLVVLSACRTGLGKPFAGESLLGLRRALRLAGARATVTSLWRIGDAVTVELMTAFYRELLGRGGDPATALRTAQLQQLATARATVGEGLPGTWGAFVAEGR